MSEEDSDFFRTLLFREDGLLQEAVMTKEWVAMALSDERVLRFRVVSAPECKLYCVLVPLEVYERIARLMNFDEELALVEEEGEEFEEEFGFDHNCYVITIANLDDGRSVEIAVAYTELENLDDQREESDSIDVDYRTRFYLGESIIFRDLLIPLAAAIELGLIPDIKAYLS